MQDEYRDTRSGSAVAAREAERERLVEESTAKQAEYKRNKASKPHVAPPEPARVVPPVHAEKRKSTASPSQPAKRRKVRNSKKRGSGSADGADDAARPTKRRRARDQVAAMDVDPDSATSAVVGANAGMASSQGTVLGPVIAAPLAAETKTPSSM